MDKEKLDLFLYWVCERYNIYLRKEVEKLPPPWTNDPILQKYKFTNPFRENDYVTRWFNTHIKERLEGFEDQNRDLLMATIIFRWFNLPATGDVMLCCGRSGSGEILLFSNWNRYKEEFRVRMESQEKKVNGAYVIKSPNGMNKVDGLIWAIDQIWSDRGTLTSLFFGCRSLEHSWRKLCTYPYMGPFMAYEVITDLRHTWILDTAEDIKTWANAGPGAIRGVNRLKGTDLNKRLKPEYYQEQMRILLDIAWKRIPNTRFEMRDIEHSLCEFDKYCRVYYNEGRTPKARYKYNFDKLYPVQISAPRFAWAK